MVVWDFDWSLINENSDTWILEQLAPALLTDLKKLQQTEPDRFGRGQWTALMDHLLTLLGTREKVPRGALREKLEWAAARPMSEAAAESELLEPLVWVFELVARQSRDPRPPTVSMRERERETTHLP